MSDPDQRYADIVAEFTALPGVIQLTSRGFARYGLKVDGKLFAALWRHGGLILKLPRSRVDWLVDAGDGARFDPVPGRVMKEWIVIRPDSAVPWRDLAHEALAFVRQAARRA